MTGRHIFMFLSLAAICFAARGQSDWNMGVKAGVSLSGQSVIFRLPDTDYTIETKRIVGPTVSLFLEYSRGKRWGIQLDVGYIPKGSSTTTESISVLHLENNRIVENKGVLTKSSFHYLSLAPLYRYRILNGNFKPYILAGPRADILLAYDTDSAYPLEEQNSIIPGLSLGGGAELMTGSLGVFFEILYQGDLIPVNGNDPMLINNHSGLFTFGLRYKR